LIELRSGLGEPSGGGVVARRIGQLLATVVAVCCVAACGFLPVVPDAEAPNVLGPGSTPADASALPDAPELSVAQQEAKELSIPFESSSTAPAATSTIAFLASSWAPETILPHKRKTEYQLVLKDGRRAIRANSDRACSAYATKLNVSARQVKRVKWSWRVEELILDADNTDKHSEDSPVRVVFMFDGDKSKLSAKDKAVFEQAKFFTGKEPAYATLMYIWENKQPVDTVIPNAYSTRVKKIVASSGMSQVGQWVNIQRNLAADYKRAFGTEPGRLIGAALMTDSDNTQTKTSGYYADLALLH
jgi:Protein of unknown function (DUF3047)